MPLLDAARDLGEHRFGRRLREAPRTSGMTQKPHEKLAAVLHLHERAHAVEPRVGLHAADRADIPGDRGRRLLAAPRDDDDVLRRALERVLPRFAPQPVTYTRPCVRASARDGLARLATASFVTQQVLTTATSAAPSRLAWPSASSRSRTACASVCDTLQPRK